MRRAMMVGPAAGGGPSWPTPPALPVTTNLWAHYQRGVGLYKDSGTTLATTNGDLIKQWNDHSGNGRHATVQAPGDTTYWPALDTVDNNLSIPSLRFHAQTPGGGSVECMLVPDMSALTEGEIYIVIKTDNDPAASGGESGLWLFDTSANQSHYPYTDGVIYDSFGSTVRQMSVNPTPSLASAYRVYNVYSKTNDWQAFLDNTSIFSTGTNSVGFSAAPRFAGTSSGSFNMKGRICEVIIYSAKLSSGDRTSVYGYCTSN